MKHLLFTIIYLVFFVPNLFSQNVEVNKKSGLVSINGIESFYLKSKNKILFIGDYSLQNLEGEELAFLQAIQTDNQNLDVDLLQIGLNLRYKIFFTKSGNTCDINNFNGFNIRKSLAKLIVTAELINHSSIDENAENEFIKLHNGIFSKRNYASSFSNSNSLSDSIKAPSILFFNANKIYENEEFIGTYHITKSNDSLNVFFYNSANDLVCNAYHYQNDSTDWNIIFANKSIRTVFYDASNPLEKLVKYLILLKQL